MDILDKIAEGLAPARFETRRDRDWLHISRDGVSYGSVSIEFDGGSGSPGDRITKRAGEISAIVREVVEKSKHVELEHGKLYITGLGKVVRVVGPVQGHPEWVHAGGWWFEKATGKFIHQTRDGKCVPVSGIKAIVREVCEGCYGEGECEVCR